MCVREGRLVGVGWTTVGGKKQSPSSLSSCTNHHAPCITIPCPRPTTHDDHHRLTLTLTLTQSGPGDPGAGRGAAQRQDGGGRRAPEAADQGARGGPAAAVPPGGCAAVEGWKGRDREGRGRHAGTNERTNESTAHACQHTRHTPSPHTRLCTIHPIIHQPQRCTVPYRNRWRTSLRTCTTGRAA